MRDSRHKPAYCVGTLTRRSVPDSAPHTSPLRPSIWRTLARSRLDGKLSNFSVTGSNLTMALRDQSDSQTLSCAIDPHRVGVRVAGQLPFAPGPGCRVVHAHLPGVPVAHPDSPARVRPQAARALALGGWVDDRCHAAVDVDAGDVIAGQGGEVHIARRGGGDAVRSAATRRGPDLDLCGGRIEPAVIAALAGEPHPTAAIERQGVQIEVAAVGGQRPCLD